MKKKINEEVSRMQEIAGIASEANLSSDAYERMDGLVNLADLNTFVSSADGIFKDLLHEGFEGPEIFEYLVSRIRYIRNN